MLRSIFGLVVIIMFGLTSCSPVKTAQVRPDELNFFAFRARYPGD